MSHGHPGVGGPRAGGLLDGPAGAAGPVRAGASRRPAHTGPVHDLPEHVDVIIVGAGLSGIGAACQLRSARGARPQRSVLVLEAREATGGTWDLFRYPGVRSDSDMTTLGYSFAPWTGGTALADGASILAYLRATAREHGVDELVRLGHRVVAARWSSERARWAVEVLRVATGETVTVTCRFLHCATGYYRYDAGHTPDLAGVERFAGRIVHPQHWPADLDVTGRRVVVIGSGSTAITLVPALARTAGRVTMLQRSPTWVVALPSRDPFEDHVRRLLPPRLAHSVVRARRIAVGTVTYRLARRAPALTGRLLLRAVAARLPDGFDVATHFTPRYDPWDQRLCVAADGDLFRALSSGRAGVVTGEVETLTEAGVRLVSGEEVPADVVVTATGLELLALGGMRLVVDGVDVDLAGRTAYRGMMITGVPNLAFVIGYTNASWTLRADLVGHHVVRLLDHLDASGLDVVTPTEPPPDAAGQRPLIEFTSGYVRRGVGVFPRQGARAPWRQRQNYYRDVLALRHARVDGEGLCFSAAAAAGGASPAGHVPARRGVTGARRSGG